MTRWFDVTAGCGYAGYKRVGWGVGVQSVIPRLSSGLVLRTTLQYGTEGRIFGFDGDSKYLAAMKEGFGVGPGLGVRSGDRHWFVLDLWEPLSPDVEGYTRTADDPRTHVSFGLVIGTL